jgi:hypothetical protein
MFNVVSLKFALNESKSRYELQFRQYPGLMHDLISDVSNNLRATSSMLMSLPDALTKIKIDEVVSFSFDK